MSTGTLMPWAKVQLFDSNGDPLAGGMLEFYDAGTTTPRDTFADVTLTVPNTNPVILDSAGRPSSGAIIFSPGVSYKVICKNSLGAIQWSQDNVSAIPAASAALDITGTAGEPLSANQAAYLSDGSGGLTAGRWYKADADLTYASKDAPIVAFVVADLDTGDSGAFRQGGGMTGFSGLTPGATYYVSATAGAITTTAPINARVVGRAYTATALIIDTSFSIAPNAPMVAEGRLTLTTAVPVTTADVTGAGTLYYTPYVGNRIALYDGATWNTRTFAEKTLALVLTSGKNYDVFAYDNLGTVTLELSAAWTTDTARADALAYQDGVLVKSGATTRRYLGTLRASGANTTEDSKAKRFLWNMYRRVVTPLFKQDSADSWGYTTATWRQANGNATNQVEIVTGQAEDSIDVTYQGLSGQANTTVERYVGVGQDSTSAPTIGSTGSMSVPGAASAQGRYTGVPAVGYHFYAALEYSAAAGTTTWYGDDGAGARQSALFGLWWR